MRIHYGESNKPQVMNELQKEKHQKLLQNLKTFTENLEIQLPIEKMNELTQSFVKLLSSYEGYKDSILKNVQHLLEKVIENSPPEIQNQLKEKTNQRRNYNGG